MVRSISLGNRTFSVTMKRSPREKDIDELIDFFCYFCLDWNIIVHSFNNKLKFSKRLLLALLPAVIWLFFIANVNRHIHMFSNGYVITHAHPFKGIPSNPDPKKTHQHSGKELMLLSLISSITTVLLLLFFTKSSLNTIPQLVKFCTNYPEPVRKYFQVHHYHGPPV